MQADMLVGVGADVNASPLTTIKKRSIRTQPAQHLSTHDILVAAVSVEDIEVSVTYLFHLILHLLLQCNETNRKPQRM